MSWTEPPDGQAKGSAAAEALARREMWTDLLALEGPNLPEGLRVEVVGGINPYKSYTSDTLT